MACLRLFTLPPRPPLPRLRVPRLRLRIALSTSLEAPREYLRAMSLLPFKRALRRSRHLQRGARQAAPSTCHLDEKLTLTVRLDTFRQSQAFRRPLAEVFEHPTPSCISLPTDKSLAQPKVPACAAEARRDGLTTGAIVRNNWRGAAMGCPPSRRGWRARAPILRMA